MIPSLSKPGTGAQVMCSHLCMVIEVTEHQSRFHQVVYFERGCLAVKTNRLCSAKCYICNQLLCRYFQSTLLGTCCFNGLCMSNLFDDPTRKALRLIIEWASLALS
jgi:hypothetical protein